jgi:adenine phosphoribosyltransferase
MSSGAGSTEPPSGGAGSDGAGAETVDLKTRIREVADFPTPGVGFKDITPLLADPEALRQTIEALAAWVAEKEPDLVLGAEARGFILGAAIANVAGCGFVPARRPGKLPPETVSATYLLEYGENVLELHPDLIPPGSRVVIHDDVLATGGTVDAIRGLVERLGAEVVGACFIIELTFLGGREKLAGLDSHALISY